MTRRIFPPFLTKCTGEAKGLLDSTAVPFVMSSATSPAIIFLSDGEVWYGLAVGPVIPGFSWMEHVIVGVKVPVCGGVSDPARSII